MTDRRRPLGIGPAHAAEVDAELSPVPRAQLAAERLPAVPVISGVERATDMWHVSLNAPCLTDIYGFFRHVRHLRGVGASPDAACHRRA
jgi:hypothetical protein